MQVGRSAALETAACMGRSVHPCLTFPQTDGTCPSQSPKSSNTSFSCLSDPVPLLRSSTYHALAPLLLLCSFVLQTDHCTCQSALLNICTSKSHSPTHPLSLCPSPGLYINPFPASLFLTIPYPPPLSPSPSSTLRPSPGHTLAAFLPLSPPYACPLSLPHLYVLQQIMYLPDCPPPTFLSFNRSLTSLPVPLLPLCSSAGNTLFPPSSVSHPSVLHNICLQ